MARSGGIALLNRGYSCAHEAFEERLDFDIQFAIFVSDGGLGRDGQGQMNRALPKWLNVFGDIFSVEQARGTIAFAIDELKDSEHLAFGVAHWQSQQRACVIARIPIVTVIEMERATGRNFVSVRKIKHFATQSCVACHGILRQRQNKLLIGKLQAVVLREHKAEMLTLVVLLYKIE